MLLSFLNTSNHCPSNPIATLRIDGLMDSRLDRHRRWMDRQNKESQHTVSSHVAAISILHLKWHPHVLHKLSAKLFVSTNFLMSFWQWAMAASAFCMRTAASCFLTR